MRSCKKAEIFIKLHYNQGHGNFPKSPACLWGAEKHRGSPIWRTRGPVPPSSGGSSVPRAPSQVPCLCTFPRSSAGEEKAMTFTEQRGMPGVCLGISLALSHSILKVSIITPFTEEKSDAQRAQSWGSVSSLSSDISSPTVQKLSHMPVTPNLCLLPWPSSCPTQWIFLCPHEA